jgi:hypothetical protein
VRSRAELNDSEYELLDDASAVREGTASTQWSLDRTSVSLGSASERRSRLLQTHERITIFDDQ